MKRLLKWLAIGLGGLLTVLIIVVGGLVLSVNGRLNRTYAVEPVMIPIPNDAAAITEGQRLASIYCANCHGEDYGGTDFFKDPALGETNARNLTAGQGGIGQTYSDSGLAARPAAWDQTGWQAAGDYAVPGSVLPERRANRADDRISEDAAAGGPGDEHTPILTTGQSAGGGGRLWGYLSR